MPEARRPDDGWLVLGVRTRRSHPISPPSTLLPHAAPKYLTIPQWSIINRPFTVIAANGFMHRRESANGYVWLRISSLSEFDHSRDSTLGENDRIQSRIMDWLFVRFKCYLLSKGSCIYSKKYDYSPVQIEY